MGFEIKPKKNKGPCVGCKFGLFFEWDIIYYVSYISQADPSWLGPIHETHLRQQAPPVGKGTRSHTTNTKTPNSTKIETFARVNLLSTCEEESYIRVLMLFFT